MRMKRLGWTLAWAMWCLWAFCVPARAQDTGAAGGGTGHIEASVVKVFSTVRYPDVYHPWTKQTPHDISGTGVVIEGNRILTNAHVVLYASQIQIQANQAGDKLPATVEAIDPGIDLAILKLDNDAFFRRHPPLARAGALPDVKDTVLAYGFPTGGTSLSITKGIVSRVEFTNYNFPVSGLRIQVDAPINPGNSGGPAVVNDKMIGLVFSKLVNAENIGYIIPNEEIELFLQRVAAGQTGKPMMLDGLQTLENSGMRQYLHLPDDVRGIVVNRPARTDPDYPLHQWDVITRIGDTPINDQGMVDLNDHLQVNFRYMIQRLVHNGLLPLTVVRGGKTLQIQLPVPTHRDMLIPSLDGSYPSYFVYGPLVFTRATREFLAFVNGSPQLAVRLALLKSPLMTRLADTPTPERQDLVVVASPNFPNRLSEGYSSMAGFVVKSVNGIPVRSLANLVSILRDLRDEFVVFEFDSNEGETQVYRREDVLKATDDILSDNGVRSQGSPDMMQIWQGRAKP